MIRFGRSRLCRASCGQSSIRLGGRLALTSVRTRLQLAKRVAHELVVALGRKLLADHLPGQVDRHIGSSPRRAPGSRRPWPDRSRALPGPSRPSAALRAFGHDAVLACARHRDGPLPAGPNLTGRGGQLGFVLGQQPLGVLVLLGAAAMLSAIFRSRSSMAAAICGQANFAQESRTAARTRPTSKSPGPGSTGQRIGPAAGLAVLRLFRFVGRLFGGLLRRPPRPLARCTAEQHSSDAATNASTAVTIRV